MEKAPTVKTSVGIVRGKVTHTKGSTKPVYNFLGIPYALPPTGERRFQAPATATAWEGILDGTKAGLPCPQALSDTRAKLDPFVIPHDETSEDCLYINIYTPDVSTDFKRPVIFYIHGGGLTIGMGDMTDGTAFSSYGDVVVVTFNYRLGALGFLNTDDDICPGNNGFLDQVAALKWVNEHISGFGGDPTNVTLIGFSAGALSVQMMLLSPLSKGLFHKAISQSASALMPNAKPSNGKRAAFKLGQLLGCNTENTRTLLEFLKNIPCEQLKEAERKLAVQDGAMFMPSVDKIFLLESPEEIYTAGNFHRVPQIVGFTDLEGLSYLMTWCGVQSRLSMEEGFTFLETFFKGLCPKGFNTVMEVTKTKYFPKNDQELSDPDYPRARVSKVISDMFACAPTYRSAMLHSRCAPTYLYVFTHRPSYSTYPDTIPGATHGDDQSLVWGDPFLESSMIQKTDPYTEEEERLSKDLIQYFTNFARTGVPNGPNLVEWPQFNTESQRYVNLCTSVTVRDHLSPDIIQLWNVQMKTLISQ